MSVKEYADRFEDLYRFVSEIMPSEEIKCDRFRSGLKAHMKTGIALYEGNNFRELVQKALAFEKAKKEEMELEHKNKKFISSSSQDVSDKQASRVVDLVSPRSGYGDGEQGSYMSTGQQVNQPRISQSFIRQPVAQSVPRGNLGVVCHRMIKEDSHIHNA